MEAAFWNGTRASGVPDTLDLGDYRSVVDVFERSCKKFADRPGFSSLGVTITYGELDRLTEAFATYLCDRTELKPGDRIAIQLPNILQYPIAVFGALRAGLVVVSTNPLYTAREMHHHNAKHPLGDPATRRTADLPTDSMIIGNSRCR